jgi:hypothetical protein
MTRARGTDMPSERLVRHVFWKYPIIAVVLLGAIGLIALAAGSPNSPRETIAAAAKRDPGGCVLAFTEELDGTAKSSQNASEFGMGDPGQVFVLDPLRAARPVLGTISLPHLRTLGASEVRAAIATYDAATRVQQTKWASSYGDALATIMPMVGMGEGGGAGMEMGTSSPHYAKIGRLQGDFGPIPTLVEADLFLAQTGYLEQYLEDVSPGHSFHLTNIWLYDHPEMLNTAVNLGLTDDQWGMVKERGFQVGPWYLFIPAVFHIYFPYGTTGTGFVLWNLAFALILLFAVPLLPGVRSLPKRLKLYRWIYRYPRPGDLEQPALQERHGPVHGGPASEHGR